MLMSVSVRAEDVNRFVTTRLEVLCALVKSDMSSPASLSAQVNGATEHLMYHPSWLPLFADIDECERGTAVCAMQSSCSNLIGSFDCMCNPGYSGNGMINCSSI